MLKEYYHLTKPGLVYGNTLTTLAALLYASRWEASVGLFLGTIFGIALIIGSACVFNNYLDRDIDAKMERTKARALVSGKVAPRSALLFGSVLGGIGFALLLIYANAVAAAVALIGFLVYVLAYTPVKKRSSWGVLVGSISGATPVVVGYTASSAHFDLVAAFLFLILVLWQMPHFYAISIYRASDYASAGVPLLPIQKGVRTTKLYMLGYIAAFFVAVVKFFLLGFAGTAYITLAGVAAFLWLAYALFGLSTLDDVRWARRLFLISLVVLMLWCIALACTPLVS